jgi:hypothetical protein
VVGGSDAVRRELERLSEAQLRLLGQLDRNQELTKTAILLMDGGNPVSEVLETLEWIPERTACDEAIQALYASRRQLREAIVATILAEGKSVSEIAASLGLAHGQIIGLVAEHGNAVDPASRSGLTAESA